MRNLKTLVLLALFLQSCEGCLEYTGITCTESDLEEICYNGKDDNCNGKEDEGCDCVAGQTKLCGQCDPFALECENGRFPRCVPTREPEVSEVCDNIDNDCDGEVDNNVPVKSCWTHESNKLDVGECRSGFQRCEAGLWLSCEDQVTPTREICDNKDNDCNGEVDDIVASLCGPSPVRGVCSSGRTTCEDGEMVCSGAIYPAQSEICNGFDDTCDGRVDEDLWRPCHTSCGMGIETCFFGEWVDCSAQEPSPEICDEIDNDCNGQVDDGIVCLCPNNSVKLCRENITCGQGIQVCRYGLWQPCEFYFASEEECNNWDDDCDNTVDNIVKTCMTSLAGIGVCESGLKVCTEGQWSACDGVGPSTEVCDDLDNDCDGSVDEELERREVVDMVFAIDISGSMTEEIDSLRSAIQSYTTHLQNAQHRFALIVFPPYEENPPYVLITDFVDAQTFSAALSGIAADGGAFEPAINVLQDIADPANPIGLSWRPNAYPYVILLTDEEPDSRDFTNLDDIQNLYIQCQLPGCSAFESIELFVMTYTLFFGMYQEITYSEPERLLDIMPPNEQHYIESLESIFKEVCFQR